MRAKILVVDDEEIMLQTLRYNLERERYDVLTAADGREAVEMAWRENPDLILLDIMLPTMDGIEVCRDIRRRSTVPIIMLTAKGDETDRVVGLEVGADDYVTKPFGMRELMARIRAALRRAEVNRGAAVPQSPKSNPIHAGPLSIDPATRQVKVNGIPVELRVKEFDLLLFLVQNRRAVLPRDTILERIWGLDYDGDGRTLDVHIHWLRERIEDDPASPRLIVTVRGVGYRFDG